MAQWYEPLSYLKCGSDKIKTPTTIYGIGVGGVYCSFVCQSQMGSDIEAYHPSEATSRRFGRRILIGEKLL